MHLEKLVKQYFDFIILAVVFISANSSLNKAQDSCTSQISIMSSPKLTTAIKIFTRQINPSRQVLFLSGKPTLTLASFHSEFPDGN